jgi:CopG family transcriptional regulator / antitoxin EndoAI
VATTVNISFQENLLADIDRLAKTEHRSRSELVREAARLYIERKSRWSRIFAAGQAAAARRGLSQRDVAREIRAHRRAGAAGR